MKATKAKKGRYTPSESSYIEPEIDIYKYGKVWMVQFKIGVQTFNLDCSGTKKWATWYAKMLRVAFSNLEKHHVTKNIK